MSHDNRDRPRETLAAENGGRAVVRDLVVTDAIKLPASFGGGGGSVTTAGPVSGTGSDELPITIADGAIQAAKLADGAVETQKIADNAVTLGKMQQIAASFLGREVGGAGDVQQLNAAQASALLNPLGVTNLKLNPTTFMAKLAAGVTDPWIPAGWLPGETTVVLHQRVSEFNSTVKSLPRPAAGVTGGVTVVLVNAGDGGAVTTQTGILTLKHMDPAYDGSAGGDNSVHLPFYCPGQRELHLMPADVAVLRQDEGHVSWRVVATAQSGRATWSIPDALSLAGQWTYVAAAGSIVPLVGAVADWQTKTRMYVDTTAGNATLEGMPPPPAKFWNGAAYKPFGGDYRRIWNLGPWNLTIARLSGAVPGGWQFLPSAAIVLAPFESVGMFYEPYGSGFWTIDK